ncbi:MAG: beta-galactosidase [Bryobacteraceae bacterium]
MPVARLYLTRILRIFYALLALSGSLYAQAMSGLYTGLNASGSRADANRAAAALKSNRYLNGVLVGAAWQSLEPAREKYDFSALDRAAAIAREAGKQYKLKITPGMYCPRWIYEAGAARLETLVSNPNRGNYGENALVPIPWDPVYQEHFSRLIRKLGERYGADPHCVGVTLTCANFMSAEMHLPKRPEDVRKWKEAGLTGARLLAVYRKYMDEWAAAFPGRLVCLHMSNSAPLPDISPDQLSEQIVLYGLEKHARQFALQSNGLNGRKETEARPGNPILKYKDRLLNGYQSFASFLTTPQRQGGIEMAVLNFVRAGAEYWELWQADGDDAATCAKISAAIAEARKLGYEAYKQKLIRTGLYRRAEDDPWPELRDKMRAEKDARRK